MIFARAVPEKVKITETYEVDQNISVNPHLDPGKQQPTGEIEITVPYDGKDYVTRQAARDIRRATSGSQAATNPEVVIGQLVLANPYQVEILPPDVRMRGDVGAISIAIPRLSGAELIDGRKAAVITHEYKPKYPQIVPASMDISVLDPDSLDEISLAELLEVSREEQRRAGRGEEVLRSDQDFQDILMIAIDEFHQKISFRSMLLLRFEVRLTLPISPDPNDPHIPAKDPEVRKVSIGWPTITSLHTTELMVNAAVVNSKGEMEEESAWRMYPVRYNPVARRVEWEVLGMGEAPKDKGGGQARGIEYVSPPMHLLVGHPGELYKTGILTGENGNRKDRKRTLDVTAEVEIPGYLLSGLDPHLFNAFGGRYPAFAEYPGAVAAGKELRPDLKTVVTVNGKFTVEDIFGKRHFSPHHNIIFDDIAPDEMRVREIFSVLKNLGFGDVESLLEKSKAANREAPEWFLRASRRRGPDQMTLWIYVEGTRREVERKQIMGDVHVQHTGSRETGQLKLHVLGNLPRDHKEITREMNALQKALRDRYQYQMASRR
jgi:hypothetical protein